MSPEIISFIVNLIIYALGFYAGRKSMMNIYARIMTEDTDSMIEHLKRIQQIKMLEDVENQTEVVVEERDNGFFVYNKETHLFLGQGNSIEEAMKIATDRFPNQIFFYEEAN